MTPQARAQAAIDLLDEIVAAARGKGAAADTLIARYFKTRRYAGSKDRRAIRELVYAAIRNTAELPSSGRAAMIALARQRPELGALFDGSAHAPVPIEDGERASTSGTVPAWLAGRLHRTIGEEEFPALLERAPLDVRVNRLKSDRAAVARMLENASLTPHAPDSLRLPEGTQIERSPLWADGVVEVQDEGSQLAALATAAKAGMTVVDLCAGAGGKTLALAAMMEDRGRIVACDVNRSRLSRLPPRAERAGAGIVDTRLLDPGREGDMLADLKATADLVLIDAPCSGTGTWRRNPEARWRLTPAALDQLTTLQAHLLEIGARLVRPGGRLVYVVCSLLREEGADPIEAFLSRHEGWSIDRPRLAAGRSCGAGILLTPAHDGTDGFFIARLAAPC